jgi:hypothetical protein
MAFWSLAGCCGVSRNSSFSDILLGDVRVSGNAGRLPWLDRLMWRRTQLRADWCVKRRPKRLGLAVGMRCCPFINGNPLAAFAGECVEIVEASEVGGIQEERFALPNVALISSSLRRPQRWLRRSVS